MNYPALLPIGLLAAVSAHLGAKVAERRARETYNRLIDTDHQQKILDDPWAEVRPIVGPWGCLTVALELLRGLGLLVAVGAGLYLLLG